MSPAKDHALQGTIFDESAVLTLEDLSRMCAVDEQHIVEFVEEGILSVVGMRTSRFFTLSGLTAPDSIACAMETCWLHCWKRRSSARTTITLTVVTMSKRTPLPVQPL